MALEKVVTEIKGYEGLYAITPNGQIWSHPKGTNSKEGRWMALDFSSRYPMICLTKSGQKKRHLVHRLVAEAFIANPDEYNQVNHIYDLIFYLISFHILLVQYKLQVEYLDITQYFFEIDYKVHLV